MNAPKKYVVSRTLEKPSGATPRSSENNVIESVRALKAEPGKDILNTTAAASSFTT